ncbi:hypothetical protein LCGC14_2173890, partial [marine sediment metagenome]
DPKLFSLSERYDFFDKLVLFEDPNNYFRIRLSIFSRFESNRPHFHRWSYVAHVLKGNYLHSVFGDEYQLINPTNKGVFPTNIYEVNENDTYFLDHSRVHAVKAKEGTVSLLLQGPPQKEKFLVIDRKTNRKWWEYGSNQETFDEQLRKKMSQERLVQMISFLTKTEIL